MGDILTIKSNMYSRKSPSIETAEDPKVNIKPTIKPTIKFLPLINYLKATIYQF